MQLLAAQRLITPGQDAHILFPLFPLFPLTTLFPLLTVTVDGEDYGDEADFIVSLGYSMDNLSFAVMANGQSEYEISMTTQFEF